MNNFKRERVGSVDPFFSLFWFLCLSPGMRMCSHDVRMKGAVASRLSPAEPTRTQPSVWAGQGLTSTEQRTGRKVQVRQASAERRPKVTEKIEVCCVVCMCALSGGRTRRSEMPQNYLFGLLYRFFFSVRETKQSSKAEPSSKPIESATLRALLWPTAAPLSNVATLLLSASTPHSR